MGPSRQESICGIESDFDEILVDIGLWFTDEEKHVLLGIHVNPVYKNLDA